MMESVPQPVSPTVKTGYNEDLSKLTDRQLEQRVDKYIETAKPMSLGLIEALVIKIHQFRRQMNGNDPYFLNRDPKSQFMEIRSKGSKSVTNK